MEAPLPENEKARLDALHRYQVLDTPEERDFDDLVKLAAQICGTPFSLVSLVDRDRQWFKGRYGLDISETPRKLSFCAHSILTAPTPLIVNDALKDPRFQDNELVTAGPRLRAYAAAPLVTPDGFALGTLCVLDKRPRQFTPEQLEALQILSRQVQAQLELRLALKEVRSSAESARARHSSEQARLNRLVEARTAELAASNQELKQSNERFRVLSEASFEGILFSEEGRIVDCNGQVLQMLGYAREEMVGHLLSDFIPPEDREQGLAGMRDRVPAAVQVRFIHKDGSTRIVDVRGRPLAAESRLRVSTLRDITDQRKAEEKLRQSQEQLDGIVRSAMDAIITIDHLQQICLFNPAAEKLFGYSASEVIGRNINLLIPESFREAHTRQVDDFGRSGTTSRRMGALGSLWGLRADGTEFPIEASISQTNVRGGKFYTVILRDITARRRAEEEIRQSQERLSLVIDAAKIGTWDWNLTTGELFWSERCRELFGVSSKEAVSYETFLKAVHPEDHGMVQAAIKQAIDNHSDYEVDLRVAASNGSRWLAVRGRAYYGSNGRPARMSGAVSDVTKRRHDEEQARQWELLFRYADFGLVYADAQTNRFIAVNPSFARQRGYTPEELAGRPILTIYPSEAHSHVRQAIRDADESGHAVFESFHQRRDGSTFPVLVEITVIRDARGKPVSRVAYALDTTELVAAREHMARSHELLERQVRERTAQLVEANTNLQSFAHSAAHDLRSPLRSISSYAQVALEDYAEQLGPDGRAMLERVVQSAERMARLINDLLEYSRVTQSQLPLGRVSLENAVRESLDMLHQEISAKNALVEVEGALPDITAHPSSVVLIISNLISNGLKFVPEGQQPRVVISAARHDPFVHLQVHDNGIGIAPEHIRKLFTVFERIHGKNAFPGTGLGLAIVKRAAERMGGKVGVESEPNKGSTFWVELPKA